MSDASRFSNQSTTTRVMVVGSIVRGTVGAGAKEGPGLVDGADVRAQPAVMRIAKLTAMAADRPGSIVPILARPAHGLRSSIRALA